MKRKIFFLTISMCFSFMVSAQYENDGLILSIIKSPNEPKVLIFTAQNKGIKTIITDQFRASNLNYVHISAPTGKRLRELVINNLPVMAQ